MLSRSFVVWVIAFLLLVLNNGQAERPPPPKAAPPLPPNEVQEAQAKQIDALVVSGGLTGGCIGAAFFLGRSNTKPLKEALTTTLVGAIVGALAMLLREELLRLLLALLGRKQAQVVPEPVPLRVPEPASTQRPTLEQKQESWWEYRKGKTEPNVEKQEASRRWAELKRVTMDRQNVKTNIKEETVRQESSSSSIMTSRNSEPDIVVPDEEPPPKRRKPFWKRKKVAPEPDDMDTKAYSPPWANVNKKEKNYVEEWE